MNTRKKQTQLHRPVENFVLCQRGLHYASRKIFNTLPASITELVRDKKQVMLALKRFLIGESFYLSNEYLNYQNEIKIDDSSTRKVL
jgi:hypothetical protein